MKKVAVYFLNIFIVCSCFSNAAQPGVFNAGGTGTFSLLFPEDSIAFKKIQMLKEFVSIDLYDGYAVVKGTYWLSNASMDTLRIKVGYPVNSQFTTGKTGGAMQIDFDLLYQLKVKTNAVNTPLLSEKILSEHLSNWYVWETEFMPGETVVTDVYFIVNTSNAIVRKGYRRNEGNGFIYVLETGAIWKQPILEGNFIVRLNDMSMQNITGTSPESIFSVDKEKNILFYAFKNLSPTSENNFIITYGKHATDFNFENIIQRKDSLYNRIDTLSTADMNTLSLTPKSFKSAYEPKRTLLGIFFSNWYFVAGFIFMSFIGRKIIKSKPKST